MMEIKIVLKNGNEEYNLRNISDYTYHLPLVTFYSGSTEVATFNVNEILCIFNMSTVESSERVTR